MTTTQIVQKVWNYCNTLRDDGVSYSDYLTQLTYLLFLKITDEYSKPPFTRNIGIPAEYSCETLRGKSGAELEKLTLVQTGAVARFFRIILIKPCTYYA